MTDQTNTIIDIKKIRKQNKKRKRRRLSQREKDIRYIKMMKKKLKV